MPSIVADDLTRMREELLFDGREAGRKLTRFWMLLTLAAVIAAAGVVSDSTATVIGAMIVAPLMTPILGSVLSVVTADLRNLGRCLALIVTGSAAVVAIGWLIGFLTPVAMVSATNSQIAGRVHPRLIDLLAALATGAVGAFALVRRDVSDTLPGVAIAISLVPPLAVVGLTLESGAPGQARGALLLFLTNVCAILLSGLVVMGLYRVGRAVERAAHGPRPHTGLAVATVVAAVVVLAVPLSVSSRSISADALQRSDVAGVADDWAAPRGWDVLSVENTEGGVEVRATGPLPIPDPLTLRADLDARGLDEVDVRVELTPAERVDLPGG